MGSKWWQTRWLDFRFGHGTYLIFLMSFGNFILITHRLLVERVPVLDAYLGDLGWFVVMFVVVYLPAAMAVGWWHRRTQLRVDADAMFLGNPEQLRLFRLLLESQLGEASERDIRDAISKLRAAERENPAHS